MNKNKFVKTILLVIMIIISNVLIFKYCTLKNENITFSYTIESDKQDIYQVFYGVDGNLWTEEQSQKVGYDKVNQKEVLKFNIPNWSSKLRIDLGNQPSDIKISDVKLSSFGKKVELDVNKFLNTDERNQISDLKLEDAYLSINTNGGDSYIVYYLDENSITELDTNRNIINNILKIFICLVTDVILFVLLKRCKSIITLINELSNSRKLIWDLSKNDFKTKYAGSYLGITWAFIQPIITILVYCFVFQFGLKASSQIKDVPFALWFVVGMVPWFFFQEALLNATNCMLEYSYLVKKVVFKISILPIVKIISAFFIHLAFIMFLFVIAGLYGFYPSKYSIQLVYYSFCTFIITLGLSYATSAIVIFFRDLGQVINIFLQIGMWATPIMWSYTIVPQNFQWIVKLNPMYYIVEGYRDTFINHVWFFERYFQTIYFWIFTSVIFILGTVIFRKLKPHFADVL
ncbi:MAG: ABC transporter permease [Clostridium sp.]